MDRAVYVWRDGYEDGYRVTAPGVRESKLFIWGSFDEGDVSWQSARAQAQTYAKQLAERYGIDRVVTLRQPPSAKET